MKITLREAGTKRVVSAATAITHTPCAPYQRILAALPLDYETRLAIADVLAEAGSDGRGGESTGAWHPQCSCRPPSAAIRRGLCSRQLANGDTSSPCWSRPTLWFAIACAFCGTTAPVDHRPCGSRGSWATRFSAHVMEQARKTALDLRCSWAIGAVSPGCPSCPTGPESLAACCAR